MKSSEIIRRDKKGTYVKLVPSLESKERIHAVANQINIENLISRHSLHTTVIYSRVECSPAIEEDSIAVPMTANGSHFDVFDNPDGTKSLVVILESDDLHNLHNLLMDNHNATYDFPEYHPHITLSYDYTHTTLPNESVIEYFQDIRFDEVVVEELILEWRPE